VDAHDRKGDSRKGRLKALYDRLAGILRGLPPARQDAFEEYLSEQEQEGNDDERRAEESGHGDG